MTWAVAEGGTKTTNNLISKLIGIASGSFLGAVVAYLVTASFQAAGAFVGSRLAKISLKVSRQQLWRCILFGTIATMSGWVVVWVFTYPGSSVGVVAFIATMSIIPGALIDWLFFGHPMRPRQWLGIGLFLLAGYMILNFPPLSLLAQPPTWVMIAGLIPLFMALNEALTQAQADQTMARLHPLANTFWVGTTSVVVSIAASLAVVWRVGGQLDFPVIYWLGAAAKGLVLVGMISFKLLSYQGGGTIAIKKLVMQGSYLISAMLLGVLFYADESLTLGKVMAVVVYFVAFSLTDNNTWSYLRRRSF